MSSSFSEKELFIDGLASLENSGVIPYRGILCDVWGVLYNGVHPFARACEALHLFREMTGGSVVLLTNAPRPADKVAAQLTEIGVPKSAYDAILTSGDVTLTLLEQCAHRCQTRSVLHLGPLRDLPLLERANLRPTVPSQAGFIVCTGLVDDRSETPEAYEAQLRLLAKEKLLMVCANPDLQVARDGCLIWCAGALAQRYTELGGEVLMAGKPHTPIYTLAHAKMTELLGEEVSPSEILAIGDGLETDIRGAHTHGFPALLITGGIHAAEFGGNLTPDTKRILDILSRKSLSVRAALPSLFWKKA